MSLIFIHGGWGKLLAPGATQAMLASHHLPMVKFGWILAVAVELGGGLAILLGLFTRPIGLVLAIWCVATALIAHTNFADRNQEIHYLEKHGDDGRVSLRRGVRRRRLESRRTVVAPRSLAAADPNLAALPAASASQGSSAEPSRERAALLIGRKPDEIERPSIVVALAGQQMQVLRIGHRIQRRGWPCRGQCEHRTRKRC